MPTTILRTNQLIFSEAQDVLLQENTLVKYHDDDSHQKGQERIFHEYLLWARRVHLLISPTHLEVKGIMHTLIKNDRLRSLVVELNLGWGKTSITGIVTSCIHGGSLKTSNCLGKGKCEMSNSLQSVGAEPIHPLNHPSTYHWRCPAVPPFWNRARIGDLIQKAGSSTEKSFKSVAVWHPDLE